jgi:PAS domain-containing protein
MQRLYQDLQHRSESELGAARDRIERSYAVVLATLESASEGIVVVDSTRSLITVNRRYAELFGVPEELVQAGDHQAIVERSMRMFPDPESARRRVAEIHASAETAA